VLKKLFAGLLAVVVLVAGAGFVAWKQFNAYMAQPLSLSEPVQFSVARGTSFGAMTSQLEAAGLINQPIYFRLHAKLNKLQGKIKAGEYQFDSGVTPEDLLNSIVRGDTVKYYFTIVEGSNFRQLKASLLKNDILKQDINDLSNDDLLQRLGVNQQHPEGLFLAETYQIERGMSALSLLKRANRSLMQELEKGWQEKAAKLPYKSSYQALTMASIVEKETGVASERPRIAGVFVRRLNLGMRLQTDPTVIYGMGEAYKGNITRKDLRKPTAYNTYVIKGLPPTPIAMVGREAINAALHPEMGKWLYFVAKGDGSHQFSTNLRDHNNAVRKYQLKRRKDYRSSPEKK